VDDSGAMIANLSISDLRGVSPENIKNLLNSSVDHFFKETKKDLLKLPITCVETITFLDAVKLMNQNHIHRIHVVDSSRRPIGVFSTTDTLVELSRVFH